MTLQQAIYQRYFRSRLVKETQNNPNRADGTSYLRAPFEHCTHGKGRCRQVVDEETLVMERLSPVLLVQAEGGTPLSHDFHAYFDDLNIPYTVAHLRSSANDEHLASNKDSVETRMRNIYRVRAVTIRSNLYFTALVRDVPRHSPSIVLFDAT
jgi:hypothetical protein